ncbi:MAG TPA: hypothetical protein VHJ38_07920 [Nitrososphaeraceae archaeon]|nr:hypothetical protein [Nitrososphaeraceae archaeon]
MQVYIAAVIAAVTEIYIYYTITLQLAKRILKLGVLVLTQF